jgi:uncharacterized membrane protein
MTESTETPPHPPELSAPAFLIPLNSLRLADPLRWLAAGWRDFRRAPGIGLFYGGCFAVMGWLLLKVFKYSPAWTLALSAGFLLVGPFLCRGLYDVSRRLERGERPALGKSLVAWQTKIGTMAIFGTALLVLEMVWARASLVVFALSFDGMPDFKGSLLKLVDPQNTEFIVAYTAVGSIFAGMIFAVSVVSIPMILDRQTDAISAALTSLRLCLTQPGVLDFADDREDFRPLALLRADAGEPFPALVDDDRDVAWAANDRGQVLVDT